MKLIKYLMGLLAVVAASLMFVPSAAEAAPVKYNGVIVEVAESLPSDWDVRLAVEDIDYWTASNMVTVSKCSGKWSCVTIKQGKVSGSPVAHFNGCPKGWAIGSCVITVDTWKAKKNARYGYWTKRWLIRHELGHFRFLGHAHHCGTTMYEYNRCNGKVPPNKFTTAEKKVLAKH